MAKVSLDYNYAAKRNMEAGISGEELEAYIGKARRGLAELVEKVGSGVVGFPALPYQNIDNIKVLSKELYRKYNDLIIVGIGGSALGFEAIVDALLPVGYNSLSFADRRGYPRYWMLDNADPCLASSVLKYCKPEDTFVVVISKSGNTIETAANFSLVFDWLQDASVDLKKHVAVITDPEKGPLNEFAQKYSLDLFPLPSNVGGRYSVLTPVGLLPAAILGVDVDKLLSGSEAVVKSDWNQCLTLAALYMYYMEHNRPVTVMMPYSSKLVKFSEWFCQLWGESLGKKTRLKGQEVYFGTTPLRGEGAIDQHSQLQLFREGPDDKFFTFIGLNAYDCEMTLNGDVHPDFSYLEGKKMGDLLSTELKATEAALYTLGRPSIRLNLNLLDEAALGELFMLYQYVVAIIGLANGINPFDQPGVEEGKDFAYGIMGKEGYSQKKEEFDRIYVKSPEYII